MKKVALLIPALLLLSACQGTNNSTETTDTATPETHSTSHSSSKETDTQSTTKKSESSEMSGNTTETATTKTETSTQNKQAQTAFEELKEKYPTTPMPQEIPITTGKLNIAAAETKQGFSILYYDLPKAYVLNAKELNQETPMLPKPNRAFQSYTMTYPKPMS